MILSELSRLLVPHSRETCRRMMLAYRKGYRSWARCGIPVRTFERPHALKKTGRSMLPLKTSSFQETDCRCMSTAPDIGKKYFKLIEEKEVEQLSFQWIFGLLWLKMMDWNFSRREFLKYSHKALHIVCDKIAEEDFSSLEELLTPECLTEVKDNFSKLEPEKKRLFPMEIGPNTKYFLSRITIVSDPSSEGSQSDEKTVNILLISASITPAQPVPGEDNNHIYKQYHAEFKRSYRNNYKSHWVISDLNMRCRLLNL